MSATTEVFEHHFFGDERSADEIEKLRLALRDDGNATYAEVFRVRNGAIEWGPGARLARDYGPEPFAPTLGDRSGTLIRLCYQSRLGVAHNAEGRAEIAAEVARDQLESRHDLGALRLSLDYLEGKLTAADASRAAEKLLA